MRWLWLLLAGCGRLSFDALGDGDASSGIDTAAPDACSFSAFAPPTRLPGQVQSAVDDWAPRSALGKTQIFFCTYNGSAGLCDIVYATRPDNTSPLSAPMFIPELDSAAYEGGPSVTEDALDMVFFRDGAAYDLFETSRASISDPWQPPQPLAINSTMSDMSPSLSPDGLRMVFASARAGSLGGGDIWETTRTSRTAAWDPPVHRIELSSASDEGGPTMSPDGLEVFFASNRAGGLGLIDVYTARRLALGNPFGAPTLVPELSSTRDDISLSMSSDGRSLFYNYDSVSAGGQNADLWVATRTCN
ncbi:MAG TPA: hypothetical protein VMZ53_18045 [Kofleriaceae bacterium]|nr:hypothetical protein [Kofleriaceae bacterium]